MHTTTDKPGKGAPRLSEDAVAQYRREGYYLFKEPVFPREMFAGLAAHFDEKLARLPSDVRPETMDVPHFTDPLLFQWLFADCVLDIVEPLIGPDITLFSSHFICKPRGNGKRVPWHEDSAYWKSQLDPMDVVTVWLAIDPSTKANGCMYVIPGTHASGKCGFSDYDPVDPEKNVFHIEITPSQRDDSRAVACELAPNEASLHDGRLMHGSAANTSDIRRCGYTMRYIPSHVRLNPRTARVHQVYLARGRDLGVNPYADPTKAYPELARYRESVGGAGGH